MWNLYPVVWLEIEYSYILQSIIQMFAIILSFLTLLLSGSLPPSGSCYITHYISVHILSRSVKVVKHQ